jgi:Uma2 family endonuclease
MTYMSLATPPILAPNHRFTVEQYNRLIEVGVLTDEDRVELLDGEIVDMTPIGSSHSIATRYLLEHFCMLSKGRAIVGVQDPTVLNEWSQPQPDFWLAKYRKDRYKPIGHPRSEDLLFVAEVSDSSLKKDQTLKVPLYARAGICEVWVIDVDGKALTVYLNPVDGEYMSIQKYKAPQKVAPTAFPDLPLDLTELFSD